MKSAAEVEFAILGAGAIGSILGAHLARAGHSVVMLARKARAEQIQEHGLRITGLADFSTPVRTLSDPSQLRRASVLIVAMKTPSTAQALAALRHVTVDIAFSVQNGPQKNELLSDAFGAGPVLGALADTSGEMSADGGVAFTRNVNILLGERSGAPGPALEPASQGVYLSPRAVKLAEVIASSGVRAAAVTNIESLEWSKFVVWAGLVILSITTRAVTWSYLSDRAAATVLVRLAREVALLVRARGIELTDEAVLPAATLCSGTEEHAIEAVLKAGAEFQQRAPGHRMSSLQDLEAGRPLEIHETLGYALRDAALRKLSVPLLEACYCVLCAIERTR